MNPKKYDFKTKHGMTRQFISGFMIEPLAFVADSKGNNKSLKKLEVILAFTIKLLIMPNFISSFLKG